MQSERDLFPRTEETPGPAQTPDEAPAPGPAQSPNEAPATGPAQTPDQAPAPGPAQSPDQAPAPGGETAVPEPYYAAQGLPYSQYYGLPQPPLTTPRKRKKLPAVLALLALLLVAGGIIWLVRGLRVSVVTTENGTAVTIAPKDDSVPPLEELFEPQTQTQDAQALPAGELGSGATLALNPNRESGALSYQEIYKKVSPSVVSILCTTASGASGSGTGIIMSQDGYIITNYHVIESAAQISVLAEGDVTYTAALVGGDESSDLAVLKVEATGLAAAEFGSSDALEVGDPVLAIGDPLGVELRGTMTDGIVSAINRDVAMGDRTMTLIQTNAALNAGNSGGPLINIYGQVVGINTMKLYSYYTTVEGLGFAIPIASAKPIVDELIEKGYVSGRPAIGIVGGEIPEYVAAYYRIPSGIYIQSVSPSSDAAAQGLQVGDVITAVNGQAVTTLDQLNAVKNTLSAGDVLQLTIFREGETFDVGITLMDAALVD